MVCVIETGIMRALMNRGWKPQAALSRVAYLITHHSPHAWPCPLIRLSDTGCGLHCRKCWDNYFSILKEKIESDGYET